jgi:hypothetical protein
MKAAASKAAVGNGRVHPTEERGPVQNPLDVTSTFACVDCARKFTWNFTKSKNLDPVCEKCKSAEVKEISPRAAAIVVAHGSPLLKPLSRRQVKRIRFIKRQWKMRCELREQIDTFMGLLDRMGLESDRITNTKILLDELLNEIDVKQTEYLEHYDSLA